MRRSMKRITGILLGVALLLTLLPTAAFACAPAPAPTPVPTSSAGSNCIVVQKTFSGINACQIPCNFTVTVKGNGACYVLTDKSCGNIQFSKSYDGLVWTWKINNASAGKYVVTECNADIPNYTLQSSGTGCVTVSPCKTPVNVVKNFTPCCQPNWPVKDGTFFAASMSNGCNVVITHHSLSCDQQMAVKNAVQKCSGFDCSAPISFYCVDNQMGNCPFNLNGACITYDKSCGQICFDSCKDWNQCATFKYDMQACSNNHTPDIVLTNNYKVNTINISGSNTWNDADDQDGIRPDSFTVTLYQNGVPYATKTVTSDDNWTWNFSNLPVCDKFGHVYKYTLGVNPVDGYTPKINGYNVTSTHTPETVTVAGEVTWLDNDDQDGIRPDSITINLYKNDAFLTSAIVTAADGWAWSFEGLDKYENHGTPIVYTIVETAIAGYSIAYDGYDVINTHTPSKIDVPVEIVWDDNDNQDGLRPSEVVVQLYANGEPVEGATLTLNEDNNWSTSFEGLDEYANGEKIVYTIGEVSVDGYDCVNTGDAEEGFTITGTHTPSKINIPVEIVWDDNDNQDGLRPSEVVVQLYADGEPVEGATLTLNEDNNWSGTFEGLDEYANGEKIVYTIGEVGVDGYDCVNTGDAEEGFTVTGTHTPSKIDIPVEIVWNDDNDKDGLRPEEVTVQLLADGEPVEGATLTLNEDNNWSGTFEGLDEYANGEKIVYTIAEVDVNGYTCVTTGNAADGFVVTASHTPAASPVVPATGDNSNIALWTSLMAVSACGLAVLLLGKKKDSVR